jgi:hypothetical protein
VLWCGPCRLLSGHREPWDAEGLFYVVALFVAGLLAGLLAPRPLWAHYLGALLGQLGYEALFLTIGPLFVLGALFLIAYSCIFLVSAAVAGRVRGRTREGLPVAQLLFFALRALSTAPDHHISPWPSTMWPNQRLERTVASGAPLAATRLLKRAVRHHETAGGEVNKETITLVAALIAAVTSIGNVYFNYLTATSLRAREMGEGTCG